MTDLAIIRKALEDSRRTTWMVTDCDCQYCKPRRDEVFAALSRLEDQQAEGWQLVPRKPTEEMMKHIVTVFGEPSDIYHQIYTAMLAAAPPPPAKGEGE